jgi:hypothetical protein
MVAACHGDIIIAPPNGEAGFSLNLVIFAPTGQSFTADSADLNSIGMWTSTCNCPNDPPIQFQLTLLNGSGTSGTPVATRTATAAVSLFGFLDFDFSGTILSVGQTYTVVMSQISPSPPSQGVGSQLYNTTDVYSGGIAFVSGQARPGLDFFLRVISSGGTSQLPDLSITSVRPLQVIFGSDINGDGDTDLVLNKSTAVLITVHVANAGALHTSANVDLHFKGVTYTRGFRPSDLDSSGNAQLTFTLIPTQAGLHQQMVATVDPANLIPESDETNNTRSVSASVRQTRPLHIAYVQITDCLLPFIGPSCYGPLDPNAAAQTFQQSRDFIRATYPIPDIQARAVASFLGNAIPIAGVSDDMNEAFRIGKRADPTVEKVVAIVPRDYFGYHFKSKVVGLSLPGEDAVLATVDYWSTPAHEIGHKLGLHRPTSWPGPGEEYETSPPGVCASGMWVDQNTAITDGICFMGSVPVVAARTFMFQRACIPDPQDPTQDPGQLDRHVWIDKTDYEFLFNSLKPAGDPQILILTGIVSENDSLILSPWYIAKNGASDAPGEGAYSVDLLDSIGNPVASHAFPVTFSAQFEYDPTPVHTGLSPFSLSVPLPPGLLTVQVKHGAKTITSFDLSTKLLLDALNAIPDRGFVNNPGQRRNALENKVQAIGHMISARDFSGATAKLQDDLEPTLNQWALDSYPIRSPLEFSKREVFDLIDEVVLRLSTAR